MFNSETVLDERKLLSSRGCKLPHASVPRSASQSDGGHHMPHEDIIKDEASGQGVANPRKEHLKQ